MKRGLGFIIYMEGDAMILSKRNMAIFLNILIIIFEIIGFVLAIKNMGYGFIKYYTQDSNLIVLVSAIIYLVYMVTNKEIPSFVRWFKFTGVVSITVTFLVVIMVLSWTMEGGISRMLFSDSMLFHHTICPILAIISFVFFEKYDFKKYKDVIRTVYFTLIYAFILIILNVLRIVSGPYPFLMVYNQPLLVSILWGVLIIGGTFIIAFILKRANMKFNKKENV